MRERLSPSPRPSTPLEVILTFEGQTRRQSGIHVGAHAICQRHPSHRRVGTGLWGLWGGRSLSERPALSGDLTAADGDGRKKNLLGAFGALDEEETPLPVSVLRTFLNFFLPLLPYCHLRMIESKWKLAVRFVSPFVCPGVCFVRWRRVKCAIGSWFHGGGNTCCVLVLLSAPDTVKGESVYPKAGVNTTVCVRQLQIKDTLYKV